MARERSTGQVLALMVLASIPAAIVSALIFGALTRRQEAALSAPLPQPIAPGHGSA